jgi:uncharacterized protein (DUF302 family)
MRLLREGIATAWLLAAATTLAAPAEPATFVYKTKGSYEDVKQSLEMAIEGRGLLVRGVSHVAEMLNRTGKDLGFPKEVYSKAEALEFCSADLSHRMILIEPSNMTTCPLTIGVYVLSDQPDQVYVSFRRQVLAGAAAEKADIEKRLYELVEGIVKEAIE